jgi:hypothetical protein
MSESGNLELVECPLQSDRRTAQIGAGRRDVGVPEEELDIVQVRSGEYFGGLIDNVRVYNRALVAEQIQTNMVTPIE